MSEISSFKSSDSNVKPQNTSAQKPVTNANKQVLSKKFKRNKFQLSKFVARPKFMVTWKKQNISLKSLIPFATSGIHIAKDLNNVLLKAVGDYKKFDLESHDYTKVIKNELAISNFVMFNIFKVKDKTDSAYWSAVGLGVNITRAIIRYPVNLTNLTLNNYTEFKWKLIKNRKLGAFFILFYWLLNRPFVKPFFNFLKKILNFISYIFFLKLFRHFVHTWATNDKLKHSVSGKDLRTSFYKLVNFGIFNLYKAPFLREKATTSKERLINILKRPNSKILGLFTPFKTLLMTVLIMGLFTLLYLTVIS